MGQLAGGFLHDFNNVLTVITGMIEILAEAVAAEPQLATAARLIDEAAIRGAALSSQLLGFARGRPSQPREVDVNALLADALRLLRPALGGIEVTMVPAEDLPPALADAGQLIAAILSLAIAARNAMNAGGALSFNAAISRTRECDALPANGDEEAIVISIKAYGYERIAEHPEQIFNNARMAQEFVAHSGGRIAVLAPSGSNACAEIRLVRAPPGASWLADG